MMFTAFTISYGMQSLGKDVKHSFHAGCGFLYYVTEFINQASKKSKILKM